MITAVEARTIADRNSGRATLEQIYEGIRTAAEAGEYVYISRDFCSEDKVTNTTAFTNAIRCLRKNGFEADACVIEGSYCLKVIWD